NTRNILKRKLHVPVLYRPLLTQIQSGRIKRIPENMSYACPVRTQLWRNSFRQTIGYGAKTLQYPFTRPVNIDVVFEYDVDEAHSKHRRTSYVFNTWQPLQIGYQGVGYLIFNQLWSAPHPLGKSNDLIL